MGVEVRKNERETSQSLIRRFTKRVQRSGVLAVARGSRYHQRSRSKQMKKRAALRREQLRNEYQRMKKLGLITKKERK
jgi:ribosomal protein S21